MSQFDITKHIDYVNHMKNYISKAEAKQIIDNLKQQLLNRPIQSHPDYAALIRSINEKHQKDLSLLEQAMRKKLSMSIDQHPEYTKLVTSYEDKIKKTEAAVPQIKCKPCPPMKQCPPEKKCPNCLPVTYDVEEDPAAFNQYKYSFKSLI